MSGHRNTSAARSFYTAALVAHGEPDEITADHATASAYAIAELCSTSFHNTEKYANNRV